MCKLKSELRVWNTT